MIRKVIRFFATVLLILGIIALLYPYVARMLYVENVKDMVQTFEADIRKADFQTESEQTDPKKDDSKDNSNLDALYQMMLRENRRLFTEGQKDLKDPFSYEQTSIDLTKYGLEDSVMGYIEIPRLHQTLPIYLGASRDNMSKGAAHLTQTSYPIGGINTNSVIAAHRGWYTAQMLEEVEKIRIGDQIHIRNFRENLDYQVVETKIIDPWDIDKVLIQKGRDLVTLSTCHPLHKNYKRYLVIAERVKK